MGGHLDPVVATARNLVASALADLPPRNRVVLAVSGGADSLALASVAAHVARKAPYDLRAVVVDHQLQAGSAEVASVAASQVEAMGVAAEVVPVDVTGTGGPEAAARRARYGVLDALEADAVLLGHTMTDQAETVLLGLGRGSGPRSIAGMSARSGRYRRPFLAMRRAETEQVCLAAGLTWWDDPHNADAAYRRVRVRREVIPLLEEVLGGGVAAALVRTADLVRADNDYLDELAAMVSADSVDDLAKLPLPLRTRVLRRAAIEGGAAADELSYTHITAIDRLVVAWHGQGGIQLPGGVTVLRRGDSLIFVTTAVGG